jgi:hypothetical protein
MAPRTVQQLFGLKPEELNALTVLSGLEGHRGGTQSPDVAAVAANAIARRLQGGWGGRDIRNIATAPGQYEAIYAPGYTMRQLADPAFGARVLGGQEEFNRLRDIVNNPSLVRQQFERSKGAQSFRGVSAYGSRKPSDYMPVPGKSNFYFDPLDKPKYQQGLQLFDQAAQPPSQQSPNVNPGQMSVEEILRGSLTGKPKPAVEEKNSIADSIREVALRSVMGLLQPINLFGNQ